MYSTSRLYLQKYKIWLCTQYQPRRVVYKNWCTRMTPKTIVVEQTRLALPRYQCANRAENEVGVSNITRYSSKLYVLKIIIYRHRLYTNLCLPGWWPSRSPARPGSVAWETASGAWSISAWHPRLYGLSGLWSSALLCRASS